MYSLAQWSLIRAGYAVKSLRSYNYVNIHHHCYLFVFCTFVRILPPLPHNPYEKTSSSSSLSHAGGVGHSYISPFPLPATNSISVYSTCLPSVSSLITSPYIWPLAYPTSLCFSPLLFYLYLLIYFGIIFFSCQSPNRLSIYSYCRFPDYIRCS